MKYIKLYERVLRVSDTYDMRLKGDSAQYNMNKLKEYIKILKNESKNGKNCDFAIKYFIILYNFILIEQGFIDDYILRKDQINLHLRTEKFTKCDEVLDKFAELYDPNSIVRNNLENFSRNDEIIKEYLKTKPNIYNRLLRENLQQIKVDVEMFITSKKYNL